MPKTFEFVPENEYRPVMSAVCSAVEQVKKIIWAEEGISFDWGFVGSANRNGMTLITREVGGNRGYDFDVNFFLKHPADRFWKADYCRNIFLQALDRVFNDIGYQHPEDRTSVIRVKFLDKRNRTIEHSCDFAIFQEIENRNGDVELKYARKADDGSYSWSSRGGSNKLAQAKLSRLMYEAPEILDDEGFQILSRQQVVSLLKEEYLVVKNANRDEEKCSFQLFNEAVSNVYNNLSQFVNRYDG